MSENELEYTDTEKIYWLKREVNRLRHRNDYLTKQVHMLLDIMTKKQDDKDRVDKIGTKEPEEVLDL